MSTGESPAVVHFTDTGNTVRLEAPQYVPDVTQPNLQGFDQMTLHIERECTDAEGRDTSDSNGDRLRINQDAARAFWQLFEALREAALRRDNIVFLYPVIPSEDIRSNPLVKGHESDWIYEGASLKKAKFERGSPVIQITDDWWADAVNRIGRGHVVPVYARFALDAFYFAQHDPPRGIIMAYAAWETALRYYLANEASKRDPAYLIASKGGNIPKLYEFTQAARGGPLFYDLIDKATGLERASLESFRHRMESLGRVRNKLLHEGEFKLPEMAATDHALAVLSAIDWLFAVP
ncbi:MAG: hypothetical protein WB997_01445 [Candidatus Acidiferrales bacterium]